MTNHSFCWFYWSQLINAGREMLSTSSNQVIYDLFLADFFFFFLFLPIEINLGELSSVSLLDCQEGTRACWTASSVAGRWRTSPNTCPLSTTWAEAASTATRLLSNSECCWTLTVILNLIHHLIRLHQSTISKLMDTIIWHEFVN